MPPAPPWRRAWRRFAQWHLLFLQEMENAIRSLAFAMARPVIRNIALEGTMTRNILRTVVSTADEAVNLRTQERARLRRRTPDDDAAFLRAARCNHRNEAGEPTWRRSGNAAGSYRTCQICRLMQRWTQTDGRGEHWVDSKVNGMPINQSTAAPPGTPSSEVSSSRSQHGAESPAPAASPVPRPPTSAARSRPSTTALPLRMMTPTAKYTPAPRSRPSTEEATPAMPTFDRGEYQTPLSPLYESGLFDPADFPLPDDTADMDMDGLIDEKAEDSWSEIDEFSDDAEQPPTSR